MNDYRKYNLLLLLVFSLLSLLILLCLAHLLDKKLVKLVRLPLLQHVLALVFDELIFYQFTVSLIHRLSYLL